MTNPIRKLPFDADAEQMVIGSALLDPDCMDGLDLRPADFHIERNRWLFEALNAMRRESIAIDYATLAAHLEQQGKLELVGGSAYIAALISATPTAFHVQDYAAIVKDTSARRALIELAGRIAGDAYNPQSDLNIARANWLADLTRLVTSRGKAEQIAGDLFGLVDEIEQRRNNPQVIYGLETGFSDWDKITKGLHPGEVFLLAGQPGMGKSLLAAQTSFQMASRGIAGVYYALEMQAAAILRRQLANATRIGTAAMRSGKIDDSEMDAIQSAAQALSVLPLYLSDATHWNTGTLRSDMARLKATANIQFAVIDHVTLLKDQADDPLERDKRISQALHDISKDFDVALLGIHTMNKAGIRSGSSISQADAAGSVRWIYDADVVAFLTQHIPYKGEQENEHLRTVTFAKYREDAPDRFFHLFKHKDIPRFDSVSHEGGY